MFKKQNYKVPEKQTSITEEQILHDIEAIRKAAQQENETNSFTTGEKREVWYTELKDFNNMSNNLVGALDDGGDLRDQLQSMQKDLEKMANKIKKEAHDILESK